MPIYRAHSRLIGHRWIFRKIANTKNKVLTRGDDIPCECLESIQIFYQVERAAVADLFPATNILLDLLRGIARHAIECSQILHAGRAHCPYRAEMFHQRLLALGTNAWYFVQY